MAQSQNLSILGASVNKFISGANGTKDSSHILPFFAKSSRTLLSQNKSTNLHQSEEIELEIVVLDGKDKIDPSTINGSPNSQNSRNKKLQNLSITKEEKGTKANTQDSGNTSPVSEALQLDSSSSALLPSRGSKGALTSEKNKTVKINASLFKTLPYTTNNRRSSHGKFLDTDEVPLPQADIVEPRSAGGGFILSKGVSVQRPSTTGTTKIQRINSLALSDCEISATKRKDGSRPSTNSTGTQNQQYIVANIQSLTTSVGELITYVLRGTSSVTERQNQQQQQQNHLYYMSQFETDMRGLRDSAGSNSYINQKEAFNIHPSMNNSLTNVSGNVRIVRGESGSVSKHADGSRLKLDDSELGLYKLLLVRCAD
ncbi:hypothetical protein HK100_000483 [Physocladia obscura]|uniref:Uncharacterized protein n=1 Tax=Physocladia obscura TaxID=109957 RepID=A0AAD5T130_9FUNG|nr:hypothetical protein HK100_000483 [Physocladia obscura]